MCGIVGYIGDKEAAPIVMEGLKRLEYRGYDSAGIAIIHNGKIEMLRRVGKLKNLSAALEQRELKGNLGIGHTRWATHGEPSETNAHPHTDCSQTIALVHNGIIENYQALRDQLKAEGHIFRSETDTEVIVHLIEKYLNGTDLENAVGETMKALEGSYAIGVVRVGEPEKLVAARKDSPLIVGLGTGENFIASDVPALLKHTRRVIYLDNGEVVALTKERIKVTTMEGLPVEKKIQEIKWDISAAEKGGYAHFMLKEIYEQPQAARHTLMGRISKEGDRVLLEGLHMSEEELRKIKKIFIIACGTASYAGLTGEYIIEKIARLPVEVDVASEFRYRDPLLDEETLVIAISQSGETADTIAGVREAKRKGSKVIAICNVVGSSVPREANGVIYTHAGPEIAVASTKAYTAQLVALYLLAIHLGRIRGVLDAERCRSLILELKKIPELMEKILKDTTQIVHCAEKYYQATNFLYLGRSFNGPNAFEGALKLKEISYIHAEGYVAGEMKHGPIALMDETMPVVCIAVESEVYGKMVSNIQETKARRARVLAVASEGDEEIKKQAEEVIYIPRISEIFSPPLVVIPLQLFAYHVAAKRGCDIDQPRNLAKSVTVE